MPHVEGTEVSGFYTTGEEQAKLPPIPTLTEEERRLFRNVNNVSDVDATIAGG